MSKKHEDLEPELPDLKWWGELHFELYQSRAFQLGSMLLRITRGLQEWRLEYYRPQFQYDYEQQWR